MRFSEYFSLDKIGGKLAEIKSAVDANRSTVVFYAVENSRYHITSALERFFLYVVPDRLTARRAKTLLSAYTGEDIPIIFERDDVLINSRSAATYSLGERLKTLTDIVLGKARGAIISAEGLIQYYPKKSALIAAIRHYKVGDALEREEFAEYMVSVGYQRVERTDERGSFSLRGDIINLYCYDNELPYRIELFDNIIESIKHYDNETLTVTEKISGLRIIPASDILVDQNDIKGILNAIDLQRRQAGLKLAEIIGDIREKFVNHPSNAALTWLIPFMSEQFCGINEYLPDGAVVVFDDLRSVDDKLKLVQNAHTVRLKSFIESGEASPLHAKAIMSPLEAYNSIKNRLKLGFMSITSGNPVFEPQEIISIKSQSLPRYYNNFLQLIDDVKGYVNNGAKVFIYCKGYNFSAFLKNLHENFIGAKKFAYGQEEGEVNVIEGYLPHGFAYNAEKVIVIGNDDIERKREETKARKRSDFVLPEKGDYVVHEKHGIGISEGMMSVKTSDGYKDFYVVLYRDGDRLYLPAGQLDTLEKYSGGETPSLHKLGGAEFARVKKKAKESIKKMTIDLIKIYERRQSLRGHKYQPDTVWQRELEDSFEFEETEDQITATNEIKQDMEQGKIMDRLLCGDVGYGKTEVAIRAIFKTVLDGKQAAVLVPTTILAQQHFNTLSARFNAFKLKIAHLSRFVPEGKIKENLEKIKSGEINVIVGTHRLLSSDVVFADLGLLVLDEEQRFGVEHKEKIKALRANVNVLSMTATPIPRTLHMSLSGIRDISMLETPPGNRIPIETYVTEYSDNLLLDAVRREIARDGQVFILYNKVTTIEAFHKHVLSLVGDIPTVFAHGQLNDRELEKRIRSFYERQASIMISTTIIENGIDLPLANTLIVIDADTLGLSQLYQLRGRVGRSNVLAYAYFTVREGKVITENAARRLEALMEYTELGSGFRIALRDLDIRGAGNVLGREQSGQMEKIGYDMYCRMIKQVLDEASGKKVVEKREIELSIEGDGTLPEDYIASVRERTKFYKRVSSLQNAKEGREYLKELTESYKKPSAQVVGIVVTGILKNLAQGLGIRRVVINNEGSGLFFYDDSCLQNSAVIGALSSLQRFAVLSPTSPPSIVFKNKGLNHNARIKLVLDFLSKATCAGE
ncbi:MAG: transcription-repair coupling factor [Clostridia bacterium]|nr:transcription-repair coupling factor [Clostridia bacterium]